MATNHVTTKPSATKAPQGAPESSARHLTPATLITSGLLAQLAGVGLEAVWHTGIAARAERLGLPSSFGFLGDHIVSNLGVLSILSGAGWILARKHAWRRSFVVTATAGAALQTVGAAWDLAGHIRGVEDNPVAYSFIGFGFILATGAAVMARRSQTACS